MDQDRLAKRLMLTFLGELDDHVHALERDLLALEREPAASHDLFPALFRTAHSLKGAARAVGVLPLEAAGHTLEDLFASGRDGRLPVDAAYFNRILPVVDEIRATGQRLQAANSGGSAPVRPNEPAPSVSPAIEEAAPSSPPDALSVPQPGQWRGVVKVAADKLDSLVGQSGELLLLRHRARARAEAARSLHDASRGLRQGWRRIEQQFTGLLRADRDGNTDAGGEDSPQRQVARLLAPHKAAMARFVGDLQRLAGEMASDHRLLEQTGRYIDADVHKVRMLPFAEACEGFDRMVRDLAVAAGKQVEIVIEGGMLEIDRAVLEGLKDPLMHLVRNAVDHGIEPPSQRRAAGKAAAGRIVVAAAIRGQRVKITITDDGAGLDLTAIRRQLQSRGIAIPDSEQDLARQIFATGFSTSPVITALSGRGVGLEVVKDRINAMRGSVDVSFVPRGGTQFTLRVPLSLTSLPALIVEVGRQIFAFDTARVDRVLRIGAADIRSIEGRETIAVSDRPVAITALAAVLGFPDRAAAAAEQRRPAVVLTDGRRRAAFVVDDVQAEREVMLRPLPARLRRVRHVTGATVLADGRVALVLNAGDLLEAVRSLQPQAAGVAGSMAASRPAELKRLLLVDDSATTRTLEKTILESAGYQVLVATDGAEAWQTLLERGADLVVSDVEMPRMDGFALTEAIRGSKQFRDLPVILMTARDNDVDRAQGLRAGANAYLFKSAFDQRELLATIGQML